MAAFLAAAAALYLALPRPAGATPAANLAAPVAPANVSLVLLQAAAAATGAVALDGSPGALYIDRGAEAGKWIVYQQGGGWSSSIEACRERANTSLGSSRLLAPWSTAVMREVDYLSNDPAINPVMWNWTHVYLPYLDGFSQVGDVEAPIATGPPHNATLYFRGARILAAQQAYLAAAGLGSAAELVVAGCSAGGLSTYLHADKWARAFPRARVTALADSGFFLNYDWSTGRAGAGQPGDAAFPSNASYPWRMWWMYAQLAGNTSALSAPCLAAQAPGSQWLCLFAENVAPHLRTPLFALQSYYDSYQVAAIANVRNASAPGAQAAVNAYGALLNARVKARLLGGAVRHGAALDACLHHCGGSGTVVSAGGGRGGAGGRAGALLACCARALSARPLTASRPLPLYRPPPPCRSGPRCPLTATRRGRMARGRRGGGALAAGSCGSRWRPSSASGAAAKGSRASGARGVRKVQWNKIKRFSLAASGCGRLARGAVLATECQSRCQTKQLRRGRWHGAARQLLKNE